MGAITLLQKKRLEYKPLIPSLLKDLSRVGFEKSKQKGCVDEVLRGYFPNTFDLSPSILKKKSEVPSPSLKVGVLFSGGAASGGHNVISALFDALKQINKSSSLLGFLDGIEGFLRGDYKELLEEDIAPFRNQGGFDLIGTGREKIETPEQLEKALKIVSERKLDGLLIIGGDDSNTNAAVLAEYFLKMGSKIRVVGVPKTIDGDLRSKDIEISFGFDTACKTYSEIIGNIARDAMSAKKYYHFIKLMGRSASHVCLECALAVQPNLALISEEKKSLVQMVIEISDLICLRSEQGKNYGVILIPEGLIEFIPEIQALIVELNRLIQSGVSSTETIKNSLKEPHSSVFLTLPEKIQKQLLLDRDPHGNIKVSQIDTEQLLIEQVSRELKNRSFYRKKFATQSHFLGYEGRSGFPSNFDANYCYALGLLAAAAIRDGLTGVICSFQNLSLPPEDWEAKAVPIVQLMQLESRKGVEKPVIKKRIIEMTDPIFMKFASLRDSWMLKDCYLYPGPIQFFGDKSLTDSVPIHLQEK